MKIKYTLEDPDADKSISLLDDLVKSGVITDSDSQVLGVYDHELILDGITPSEQLNTVLAGYPGFKIFTDPSETDAFHHEEGMTDEEKIGTVQSPTYQDEDPTNPSNDLSTIQLFPETETATLEDQENVDRNSFNNNQVMARKNFNDPTLDPNGVSTEGKQAAVEAEANKDNNNYQPAEGSFSSVDVEPFTEEEIEKANDPEVEMNGNEEVKVFSEEEIEAMTDPDEVEELAEQAESEEVAFAERKKRLFAAKRRLRRVNSKRDDRKTFAEELTEKEQSDVIEDIVAILTDAPEIRDAVAEEVEELTPSTEITTAADESEVPVEDTEVTEEVVEETPVEEPVVEPTEEEPAPTEEPVVEETEEEEVTPFSEEEIEDPEPEVTEEVTPFSEEEIEAPETDVEDIEENYETFNEGEETEVEEESETPVTPLDENWDSEETGNIFCKTFSDDNCKSYRHNMISRMAKRHK